MAGISLLKRGWHELPDVMCAFGMSAVGLVATGIASFIYIRNGDLNHQYKSSYTVVRDTDVKNPDSPALN